jgi:asparagine synthase (glutamine-hydrolysing)
MCGIVGKVMLDQAAVVDEALLQQMTAVICHRGPDDGGTWTDGRAGLGTRRLAVIDLSSHGHQPMSNEDGSVHITFNGEIYNFQELRPWLESRGHAFRSQTDTEVILHLYEEEGPDCVHRLNGMFAFAIWDSRRRRLFAARDRLGKKPFFYAYQPGRWLVFGSEPKSLLQDPEIDGCPDWQAIDRYLTLGYVPAPLSAFRGLRKLLPGHRLVLDVHGLSVERYWRLSHLPKRTGAEAELAEELRARLTAAVRRRLISDVPLGALLSGGVDSSVVVAVMRQLTSGPIRTFSIGFDRPEYDELKFAREVAHRFETVHTEMRVRSDDVSMLPRLVWHYNEPFADSSALPSMAVCALARQHVTVALNGDGGDEAFAGYDRYLAAQLAGLLDRIPPGGRRLLARLAAVLPAGAPKSAPYRLRRFIEVMEHDPWDRYLSWMTILDARAKSELYTPEFTSGFTSDGANLLRGIAESSDAADFIDRLVHMEIETYLPDDLLVKMDIASMANSLEVRSPFLDEGVIDFAASLPPGLKLRGLTQKYILKRAYRDVLPASVVSRKKMGFGVPIDHWFRHEIREMAYDVLLSRRARERGYFNSHVVERYLSEHTAGRRLHHTKLWALLMLELWHLTFVDQPCPRAAPASIALGGATAPGGDR